MDANVAPDHVIKEGHVTFVYTYTHVQFGKLSFLNANNIAIHETCMANE